MTDNWCPITDPMPDIVPPVIVRYILGSDDIDEWIAQGWQICLSKYTWVHGRPKPVFVAMMKI